MNASTISAVIPCYNGAHHLERALGSVVRQTRRVGEIIVVDDCSTDGSRQTARRSGATVLSTPRNSGPAAARNIGIRAARGDVIAFLDADDYWEPGHCAAVVPLLERYPEAAVAYSRMRRFDGDSGESAVRAAADVPIAALRLLARENLVPQAGAVVRRTALLEVGGYEESMRYSEDYDLWLRLARRYPFVCTHEVTINYRVHEAQATRARNRLVLGSWRSRHRLWSEVRRHDPESALESLERVLLGAWQDDLRWAWRERDRDLLDLLLSLGPPTEKAAALRERWTARAHIWWPLWIRASGLWSRLPQTVRRAVWASLSAARGSPRRADQRRVPQPG